MTIATKQAWKVTINDLEWVYVFAESEEEALEHGPREWQRLTGFGPGDDSEPEVERTPDLDGDAFTTRQLVNAGLCDPASIDGWSDHDLDEPLPAVYLSTEW